MGIPGSANPLLLASADAAPASYQVSRSLRFNAPDSAFLSRTPSSAGNRKTWTFSCWLKRAAGFTPYYGHIALFSGGTVTGRLAITLFNDTLAVDNSGVGSRATTAVFRDYSAWYHIVVAFDTTNATASDRIKFYVNGAQQAVGTTTFTPALNTDYAIGLTEAHNIGRFSSEQDGYFAGLLAEIHFIDGQALTPSSFAETNATTGQWVPKAYTGSYGTNGFKLDFSDNSAATAAALGKDVSGNGNNFSPVNLSVTAGSGNDSLVDTPTSYGTDTSVGGEVRGNYCTLTPLSLGANTTILNGNLDGSQPSGAGTNTSAIGTIGVSSGKWYWEVSVNTRPSGTDTAIGIANSAYSPSTAPTTTANSWAYLGSALKGNNASFASYGATYGAGDVIGVALDLDNGTLTFYKNGSSQGQAYSGLTSGPYFPLTGKNEGGCAWTWSCNFGQRPFAYPVSGFKALCDTNLPSPQVAKPSTVFDTKLYTGNGSTQNITGLGFSPDLVWIKNRASGTYWHVWFDTVRGAGNQLSSNQTDAELASASNVAGKVSAFNSDGFTVAAGSSGIDSVGANTVAYVAWCWDAGSSNSTNNAGSITSTVRANASAGFSIVTFTSQASGSATVGHGLGVAPQFIITKARNTSNGWGSYHVSIGSGSYIALHSTAAATSGTLWNNTNPTASVFSLGSDFAFSYSMVAYCFAPVSGYSSMSSFVGNGSSDGVFVYTGFRPRFVMIKRTNNVSNWFVHDSARSSYNAARELLFPNLSNAEDSSNNYIDLLSNGFKLRFTNTDYNTSNDTYIYFAVAESPFAYSRAR